MYELQTIAGLVTVKTDEPGRLLELREICEFTKMRISVRVVNEAMFESFGLLDVTKPGVE